MRSIAASESRNSVGVGMIAHRVALNGIEWREPGDYLRVGIQTPPGGNYRERGHLIVIGLHAETRDPVEPRVQRWLQHTIESPSIRTSVTASRPCAVCAIPWR